MSRRRRGADNSLTTIYWRDIPSQVTVSVGGATHKEMLEPRFQHAIDRAAAVANLTATEDYIAQWERRQEALAAVDVDPVTTATAAVRALTDSYPRERLEQLVAQGGAEALAQPDRPAENPNEEPSPS